MVAKAFSKMHELDSKATIFASGVSNSRCSDDNEYSRESLLLATSLSKCPADQMFIYFSTCSIYDSEAHRSPYVTHKIRMEKMVMGHPAGYIIRFPQLMGPNAPSGTLIPVLVSKMCQEETIDIWQNATRNILDVEDAAKIVNKYLLGPHLAERIINVANPYCVTALELVNMIEVAFGIKAKINMVPKGTKYIIDVTRIQPVIECLNINFSSGYVVNALRKYYL